MRRLAMAMVLVGAVLPGLAQEAPAPAPAAPGIDPWKLVWHGYAFLDSNRQGGPSGGRVFESINHLMVSAERPLGAWTMSVNGTFTLEPATVPVAGSPLLFQRGETYGGVLLIDKQHAHDLFVQLEAGWSLPLAANKAVRLSAALRGAPAVGPVAYPHRLSASEIPMAPLSHHNLDSTHISDDVLSAGLDIARVSVEGSWFHGAEPDENRWDLDQGKLDSYAGRVTVRVLPEVSFQVSACRRTDPEALEDGNQTRVTASVAYEKPTADGFVAALLASGKNETQEGDEWGHLLEATWRFRQRHFTYARIERVDRDTTELTTKQQRPPGVEPDRTVVEELTMGYACDLPLLHEGETAIGAAAAVYHYAAELDPVYGDHPISFWAYLRLRFGSPGGHAHHH